MRIVAGAAQQRAVGNTMREPGNKLFHLARRAVHGFVYQHFEIRADHLIAVRVGWLIVAAGFSILANLAEDPRIRSRSAADHHAITSGLRYHGDGIFRRANIPFAEHRNLPRIFPRRNPLPASVATVTLFARASM